MLDGVQTHTPWGLQLGVTVTGREQSLPIVGFNALAHEERQKQNVQC